MLHFLAKMLLLVAMSFTFCGITQLYAEEPDLTFMLEDFEGNFSSQSPYGNVPDGWSAYGGDTAQFDQVDTAHHGNKGLFAHGTPATDWTLLYKTFQFNVGETVKIQIQAKASTSTYAQVKLVARQGGHSIAAILHWYSTNNSWRTADVEFTVSQTNVDIEIWVVHGEFYSSSDFYIDCLTSNASGGSTNEPMELAIDFGSTLGLFTYIEDDSRLQSNTNSHDWQNKQPVVKKFPAIENNDSLPPFAPYNEPLVTGSGLMLPEFMPQNFPAPDSITIQSSVYEQVNTSDPLHIAWVDLDGDSEPELLASYAGEGIRIHYQDGSETLLHSVVPDYFCAVDVDGDGKEELAITFAQYGFYIYKKFDESWTKIHSLIPTYFSAVDFNGDGKEKLALNFSQLGFYTYEDGNIWTRHHSILPLYFSRVDLDGDGNEQLAITFQQFGLYLYDGTWTRLHSSIPEHFCQVDMNGDGKDELAVSFDIQGLRGLYTYAQGNVWSYFHSFLPSTFVNCDVNGNGKQELAVVLDGYGLYTYEDGAGWSQLHTQEAQNLASWLK